MGHGAPISIQATISATCLPRAVASAASGDPDSCSEWPPPGGYSPARRDDSGDESPPFSKPARESKSQVALGFRLRTVTFEASFDQDWADLLLKNSRPARRASSVGLDRAAEEAQAESSRQRRLTAGFDALHLDNRCAQSRRTNVGHQASLLSRVQMAEREAIMRMRASALLDIGRVNRPVG